MDNPPSACIPNIGTDERRKRLIVGIVAFVVGAAVAAGLIAARVGLAWRIFLLVPFYVGAVGVFQAHAKT
ncbi:MAG: hypothetical protein ACJ78R_04890 [Gemmatimonadaceae bacterium]